MYHHLRGRLVHVGASSVVLEASGVGYELHCARPSLRRLARLGRDGAEVVVLTHLMVREDEFRLYGFADEEERRLFRVLLGVTGVGPGVALAVLSEIEPADLRQAVAVRDPKPLQRVKGVGRKTAERLVLELQDRLPDAFAGEAHPPLDRPAAEDAAAALVSLGYAPAQAARAVAETARELAQETGVQDLVRAALARAKAARPTG